MISNLNFKTLVALLILLFVAPNSQSQNAISTLKVISGKITHLDNPLPNVNIIILDANTGTKTDIKGRYTIKANIGDIIKYSHIGFNTVSIIVEDVTSILNFKMIETPNELSEVVVVANKKTVAHELNINRKDERIKTSMGKINPMLFPSKVKYISGNRIQKQYRTLSDALQFYYPYPKGLPTDLFDVDGVLFKGEPLIDLSTIIDIYVVEGSTGAMRWGESVMIIRTTNSKELKEQRAEQYRNQNYYKDDATAVNMGALFSTAIATELPNTKTNSKRISGKIRHLGNPLPNVNISIKNSNIGTKTDVQGRYSLKASIGDIIKYSHVGFNTISIVVEDVTSVLNIEMTEKVNQLAETVVTARKVQYSASKLKRERGKPIMTAVGMINPESFSGKLSYFDKNDFIQRFDSFTEFWKENLYKDTGKFIGVITRKLPGTWDVDGVIYNGEEPPINFNRIIDIHVIEDGATKWGTLGGVVIVRTLDSPQEIAKRNEAKAEQYRNQNYYEDDAVLMKTEGPFSSISKNSKKLKTITGKITHLDAPLANVNISLKNQVKGTKSNLTGEYTLQANIGDMIQYSHIGYKTVSVIVEDITTVLNIEMYTNTNTLDEVTVTAKTISGKAYEDAKKKEKVFATSRGIIDPKRVGYAISFLGGEDIDPNVHSTLSEALDGKLAGVRYDYNVKKLILKPPSSIYNSPLPIWDVDGAIYDAEPPMDLNNIKSVHILRTLASTNRYGSLGAGGVIVVQTRYGSFDAIEAKRKKITEQYTNKTVYANDATSVNTKEIYTNSYTSTLEEINNKQKAFAYYNQVLKTQIEDYSTHISIAQKFMSYYNDTNLTRQILNDLSLKYSNNTEILKAIAFQFQALGLKKETISTYESIFKLRPKYAQSYRDLANAYVENDQYKKAWRLYLSYIMQGNDVSDEGIGRILYNEMEFLYYNRRQQTAIKEKFIPKSDNLFDFRNDVRLVFEWNTSEAEFDLEFVNADKRVYVFEHSLAANQELITSEKKKGYSSKEFKIDDIGIGEWLVNITYKGNKKPEPTYFKITKYLHWGKSNQTQEVAVYKFESERNKIQLMQLNKELLAATNQ